MQLCETVNKVTGNKRYYADSVQINRDRYDFLKIMYKTWSCLHSVSDDTHTRHYMTVTK